MTPSKVFFSYTDTFEFSKLSIKNNKFFKTLCLRIYPEERKIMIQAIERQLQPLNFIAENIRAKRHVKLQLRESVYFEICS